MPRAKEKKDHRTRDEVVGLILLGAGTLVLLSLVSYTPQDLPDWFPLSHVAPPNHPAENFIGPFGAILASCLYFAIGAAAYLVAAATLGYGGALLLAPGHHLVRRLPWAAGFVLSGAALLQLQPWFLQDWPRAMNVAGPGGWLGAVIGHVGLRNLLGTVGAAILLSCVYVASLVMMTGIRPVAVLRWFLGLPGTVWDLYTRYRLSKADERERLELERKRLEREAKRIAKELARQKKASPVPAAAATEPAADEPEAAPEEPPRPTPQIIDTSLPAPAKNSKQALVPREPIRLENYHLPGIDLLDTPAPGSRPGANPEELKAVQAILIDTLAQFGIEVAPGDITKGSTITRYEIYPAKGVRVDRIANLERDLARATRAERINILAPIPGKDTVGVEIANTHKIAVTLRELFESEVWQRTKARIPLAIGKDVYGKTIIADLAEMPHCLVAGTTGSGKSVCINAMIASLLYRFTPEEARIIMIDPKVVELQAYNKLPHLVVPVVTDPKKVLLALRWVIDEMEKRYRVFARTGVKNITGFNARPKPPKHGGTAPGPNADADADGDGDGADGDGQPGAAAPSTARTTAAGTPPADASAEPPIPDRLPYIVVIIDELADLMQTAPADVETAISRITQMARAAGIHLIVATQTPRADVVTGVIKANIPTKIAFQVASKIDSRVILDENGADRLLGKGDMLYLPPGGSRLVRAQGVLITEGETLRLVDFVAAQGGPSFEPDAHEKLEGAEGGDDVSDEDEELVQKCIEVMRQERRASTSLFQRRLRLGYTRAARVVDILEQRGILAPGEGAKPREILVDLDTWEP